MDAAGPGGYAAGADDLDEIDEIDDVELVVEHLVPELDPAAANALRAEAASLKDLPPDERLPALLAAAQRIGALPKGAGADQARTLLRVYRTNVEAARTYRPQPYAGRVLLVRATEGLAQTDPLLGWGDRLRGEVEVLDAEGNHYTILQGEMLRGIGRYLRTRLASGRA
jgi:thioesterase domain-containing protein